MEEDEVILEVDVFISKTNDNLYLCHHPTTPSTNEPTQSECVSARINTKKQKVELEFSLDTDASNYDRKRGEQIASDVDGQNPTDKIFFESNIMDKYVITGSAAQDIFPVDYAVGLIRNGELHITPFHSALELQHNFNYMDKIECSAKKDQASDATDVDKEAAAVAVSTEERNANESWISMNYHPLGSQVSQLEYDKLSSHPDSNVPSCNFTSEEYLKSLIPENIRCGKASDDKQIFDQIKQLMINSYVLRYETIIEQLPTDIPDDVLQLIQEVAVLVQGCWVVKSEFVYTQEKSPITGISSAFLIIARDFVVYCFTQSLLITKQSILSKIAIPDEELNDILIQIAVKIDGKWKFKYPCDIEFIENNRHIVVEQTCNWSMKYQTFRKIFKSGTETLPRSAPPEKKKKRCEDGEEKETGAETRYPAEASKPYITALAVSATETSPSEETKTQLREYVEEIMRSQCVVTVTGLRNHIICSSLNGLCNRRDFEQLLDEALDICGAKNLKNKWPENTTPEPLYVFCKFGNKLDTYRAILVELFSNTARITMNIFVKSVEDILKERISDSDSRQILEEYCTYKSGYFYLKGTISPDL